MLGPRTDGVEETNDASHTAGEKRTKAPEQERAWQILRSAGWLEWNKRARELVMGTDSNEQDTAMGSIIKKVYVDITPLGVSEKFRILVYSNILSPFVSYLEFGLFGFLFPDTENFCCISTGCQGTL